MALVQIDGRAVEYLVAGAGEAVLLCGPDWWPLDAWTLSGIPQLSDRYQVVAFNQRGIGQSAGTPDDYDVHLFARDTLALMDALDIPSAHLLGFAIGAVIALVAARQQPTRVRSLVLAAAGRRAARRAARRPGAIEREIAADYRAHIRNHALNDDFAFHPANFRAHPERAEALADALWEHAGPETEFRKHVLARQGYVTTEGLAEIHTRRWSLRCRGTRWRGARARRSGSRTTSPPAYPTRGWCSSPRHATCCSGRARRRAGRRCENSWPPWGVRLAPNGSGVTVRPAPAAASRRRHPALGDRPQRR